MYRLATGHYPPNTKGFPMTDRAFRERLLPSRQLNPQLPEGFGELIDNCLEVVGSAV